MICFCNYLVQTYIINNSTYNTTPEAEEIIFRRLMCCHDELSKRNFKERNVFLSEEIYLRGLSALITTNFRIGATHPFLIVCNRLYQLMSFNGRLFKCIYFRAKFKRP